MTSIKYEERFKERQLNTLEDRCGRGDLITIYKLMFNLEETDRKNKIMSKGEARYLKTQEKIAKRNLFERYKKVQFFPKKYRYLEWTEGKKR